MNVDSFSINDSENMGKINFRRAGLNDLQEIAYLRKLIRLLFTKTEQLQPGETGIT